MKKGALVVGVGEYGDPDICDVEFAARDAEAVGRCLSETCGFDDVRVLASGGDGEPEHMNATDALHRLAARLTPDDLLVFYFAGHCVKTLSDFHLLTSNSILHDDKRMALSGSLLADWLSRTHCAGRVLILDAWRNEPRGGDSDRAASLTASLVHRIMDLAETPVEGAVPATAVLLPCQLGEKAHVWPEQGHSVFAHFLLEGLRGAAADPAGRVTADGIASTYRPKSPAGRASVECAPARRRGLSGRGLGRRSCWRRGLR